jgi:hypothetical protein
VFIFQIHKKPYCTIDYEEFWFERNQEYSVNKVILRQDKSPQRTVKFFGVK